MNNVKGVYNRTIREIREYFQKNNIKKAVIGLSGGIDSSLSAKLVADAIGKENVHGIIMPVKGLSSDENIKDAVDLCGLIGISYSIIYINDFVKDFEKLEWQSKIARMNTASRIRAVILYHYANTHNALVIGTSNKTEIMLGYFTKYGDGAVDIEVIGSLFKTDELELARFLKIPEKLIQKTPTAELYHGQTDEDELGVTYIVLDKILKLIEKGLSEQDIIKKGFDKKIVRNIIEKINLSKHKRRMPEVIKVS
ncbi:NAD+ synthase [Candidatus Woesearchaeota archaeon]|nr:NAD+ synthase [Candidatus Woesearchaeota archaeon]